MRVAERATTLWELTDEWLDIAILLDDPDADPLLVEQQLDRIGDKIAHKVENIAGLVRRFEGLAEFRKAEGKRMVESAARFERQAEWLRGYVLKHMQATDSERIDTGRYTLSVRQNPPRVDVLEAMLVPSEFQRTKVTIDVDKRAVTEHWKATGEIPPGVEIVRGTRLDIR